jgi:hypothetical protein
VKLYPPGSADTSSSASEHWWIGCDGRSSTRKPLSNPLSRYIFIATPSLEDVTGQPISLNHRECSPATYRSRTNVPAADLVSNSLTPFFPPDYTVPTFCQDALGTGKVNHARCVSAIDA